MDATGEGSTDAATTVRGNFRRGKRQGLLSDLAAFTALAVSALFIGSLVNASRVEPLPWKYRSREQNMSATLARMLEAPAQPNAANQSSDPTHEIRLEEFQPFVAEHSGPVLDARPAVFYREAHIPGALSLPRETFADDYPRLRGQLETFKDRPIAVYCSGADCPDSELVAEALTKLGYRHLVIYTSGWEEWSGTGLPQEGARVTP